MARQARSIPYLVEREGRYWARVVVPADARPALGKRELRAPLGADRREAMRNLHLHVTDFLDRIAAARHGIAAETPARITRPLSRDAMAWLHYREELTHDEAARNRPLDEGGTPALFRVGHADVLRSIAAGRAGDHEIAAVVGWAIEKFAARGNTIVDAGSPAWRELARTIAIVQLEALDRAAERDRGDFAGAPRLPALAEKPAELDRPASVPLLGLLDAYLNEKARYGKGTEARKRWTPVFKGLVAFLKHDDAQQITKADVVRWMEKLLETKSPKTVKDTDLGSIRAVLGWAHRRDKIASNPVADVKLESFRAPVTREKGLTDDEAKAVLQAAKAYQPPHSDNPQTREKPALTAAKRWVPWLCAHTGGRVAEMAQLRREDVQERGGITFIRITPDAGSVKTAQFRDVPVHPQLVELGFLQFVAGAGEGPLFFDGAAKRTGKTHAAKTAGDKVSKWVRELGLISAQIDPSHGWRHRFKTVARDVALDPRVVDAIQGHAARTAGENYGDVTLKARAAAIVKMPAYDVKNKESCVVV